MARAYSSDLRERVVAAVDEGQSCREVASVFRVSVVKWSQRARQTGAVSALPMGGRPRTEQAGRRTFVAAGPFGREARPDAEEVDRGTAGAWRGGRAGHLVAFPASRRDQLQKKPYSPASRIDLTLRAVGPGGESIRTASIRDGWCSSTRPGPRPI